MTTLKELAQKIVDELYSHEFLSERAEYKTDFDRAIEQVYQTLLENENERHSYGC